MGKAKRHYMTDFDKLMKTITIPLGAKVSIKVGQFPASDEKLYYGFALDLWVDFLNADPRGIYSMWDVYSEFVSAIKSFENRLKVDIDGLNTLSKRKFMEIYPQELQTDARKLHAIMMRQIGEQLYIPDSELDIPSGSNEIDIKQIKPNQRLLLLPEASHPNFWLAVIRQGMELARRKDGKILIRQCAAPDCDKYFVPALRSHSQVYHSETCRNRIYIREWRRTTPVSRSM